MKKIVGLLITVCFLAIPLLFNTSGDGKKSISVKNKNNPTSPSIKEVGSQSDIVTTKFGFEIK